MSARRHRCAIRLFVALGLLSACDSPSDDGIVQPSVDFTQFRSEVYPVLLRDCSFAECHGSADRFFRVWGPGRARLPNADGTIPGSFDDALISEAVTTFELARAVIDARDPDASLLLRKPLAVEEGGAGHVGVDQYGRDVYRTRDDEGYVILSRWVRGEQLPDDSEDSQEQENDESADATQ